MIILLKKNIFFFFIYVFFIKDSMPDHVIDRWYTKKERRLKSRPHNYPAKKRPRLNSAEYVDLSTLMMSDLENSDDEECFSLYMVVTVFFFC